MVGFERVGVSRLVGLYSMHSSSISNGFAECRI